MSRATLDVGAVAEANVRRAAGYLPYGELAGMGFLLSELERWRQVGLVDWYGGWWKVPEVSHRSAWNIRFDLETAYDAIRRMGG